MASQSDRNSTGHNHSTCLDLPARKRRIRRNKFRRRLEYFTRLAHTGLEAPVLWYCLSWSLRRCPVYASTGSQSPHLGIRCRFYRQPYMFTSGRGWKTVNIKSNISEQIPIVVRRQNLKKKKKKTFYYSSSEIFATSKTDPSRLARTSGSQRFIASELDLISIFTFSLASSSASLVARTTCDQNPIDCFFTLPVENSRSFLHATSSWHGEYVQLAAEKQKQIHFKVNTMRTVHTGRMYR